MQNNEISSFFIGFKEDAVKQTKSLHKKEMSEQTRLFLTDKFQVEIGVYEAAVEELNRKMKQFNINRFQG